MVLIILSNTTPQIQDNQNHQEDNIKEKEQSDDPMVLVILLQILPHKLKIIKTTKKIILKKKNKVMTLVVLVILLQILTHKFKIIKTTKKIILKKKNKVMTLETY
nr:hypothetical protein [Mycoplasmopsis bovis]